MSTMREQSQSLAIRKHANSGMLSLFHFRIQAASLLLVALSLVKVDVVSAKERIWLEPAPPTVAQGNWFPRDIEVFSGTVIGFDSQQFRFVRNGQTREIVVSGSRVVWIEPDQISDLEKEMLTLFKQGQYAQALAGLPAVLKTRPAVWRQQWLTMLSATSAWKIGRAELALDLVGQLDRRPLPAMVLAWLPIAWESGVQTPESIRVAKQRAQDPSSAVRLVSASWLLSSVDRSQGLQIMNDLVKDPEAPQLISQLAGILSWRMAAPNQVAPSRSGWEKQINALPLAVQTGPTRLLMDKLRAAGQTTEAKRLKLSLELTPVYGLKKVLTEQNERQRNN